MNLLDALFEVLGLVLTGKNAFFECVVCRALLVKELGISEETARIIDEETKRIIEEALQRAKQILLDKKPDLEKLAQSLLEYETLSGEEIRDLLAGKEIRKSSGVFDNKSAVSFIPSVSGDAVA